MHKTILAFTVLAVSVPVSANDTSATYNEAVTSSYAIMAAAPADFVRAKRELAAGNYGEAARLLEYLADGSRNPAVPLLAGFANLGAGNLGRAELYFGRTLTLDMHSAEARQGLGLAALARGDRAEAQAQLAQLEDAQRRCTSTCSRAEALGRAVTSLRRVLH
jgi:tetratricopeptide (TPR) repeat protein